MSRRIPPLIKDTDWEKPVSIPAERCKEFFVLDNQEIQNWYYWTYDNLEKKLNHKNQYSFRIYSVEKKVIKTQICQKEFLLTFSPNYLLIPLDCESKRFAKKYLRQAAEPDFNDEIYLGWQDKTRDKLEKAIIYLKFNGPLFIRIRSEYSTNVEKLN